MNAAPNRGRRLPYSYNMLWVSLAGALFLLLPVLLLHEQGVLSTGAAIWIAVAVVVAAACYESCLLYLLTRHMFRWIHGQPGGRKPRDGEPPQEHL